MHENGEKFVAAIVSSNLVKEKSPKDEENTDDIKRDLYSSCDAMNELD